MRVIFLCFGVFNSWRKWLLVAPLWSRQLFTCLLVVVFYSFSYLLKIAFRQHVQNLSIFIVSFLVDFIISEFKEIRAKFQSTFLWWFIYRIAAQCARLVGCFIIWFFASPKNRVSHGAFQPKNWDLSSIRSFDVRHAALVFVDFNDRFVDLVVEVDVASFVHKSEVRFVQGFIELVSVRISLVFTRLRRWSYRLLYRWTVHVLLLFYYI